MDKINNRSDQNKRSDRNRLNIPSDIPDDFFEIVSGLVEFIEEIDKDKTK